MSSHSSQLFSYSDWSALGNMTLTITRNICGVLVLVFLVYLLFFLTTSSPPLFFFK